MRWILSPVVTVLFWIAAVAPLAAQPKSWSNDEVRAILAERIDVHRRSRGIVVGLIGPEGRRIVTYGRLSKDDPRPLDGDTLFEIGSITKVFTALLLADMAQRGEVAIDDPVATFLPPQVSAPGRDGRVITLRDLSNHRSGLPRMPGNFAPQDTNNPYIDYNPARLYGFLSTYQLPRDIGTRYEYSNLAVGLLGHVLARRAGMDFEALLRARVIDPLGLTSTRIHLTPEMRARLAAGHNADLEPTPNWDFDALAAAGALRSNANDLLAFLAATMGGARSTLEPSMKLLLAERRPAFPDTQIALGWFVTTKFDDEIVWHDGGTGGYQSFAGYSTRSHQGVVVLSNSQTNAGINDIARHLLNTNFPLLKLRREIATKPELLQAYAGRYRLSPTEIFAITQDGNRLFAQLTGQGRYELYAESDGKYFYKVVDAQITFEIDDNGKVPRLILHQNGKETLARRVDE